MPTDILSSPVLQYGSLGLLLVMLVYTQWRQTKQDEHIAQERKENREYMQKLVIDHEEAKKEDIAAYRQLVEKVVVSQEKTAACLDAVLKGMESHAVDTKERLTSQDKKLQQIVNGLQVPLRRE